MKKFIRNILILTIGLFVLQACDNGSDPRFTEDPTTGWIEFRGSGSTTISLSTETLNLPIDIQVPIYTEGLTISYQLEAVQGDFTQIVSTGTSVFASPDNTFRGVDVVLDFFDLDQLEEVIVFDVVLTDVSGGPVRVGIDEGSVTRYRISTPCPVVINEGDTFTGVEVLYNGQPGAPTGYTSTVLEEVGPNTYSIDTVWGPGAISTLCGGCVPPGDYSGPITFSVDLAEFEVTVISGGEPSGVGNTFDIPYNISGVGSYNSCDESLSLDLTQDLLTSNGVPGSFSVRLTKD